MEKRNPSDDLIFKDLGNNSPLKNYSFAITLVLLALFFVFIPKYPLVIGPGSEKVSDSEYLSSRLITLNQIVTQANQGNYFQVAPGVPMEKHWEDPGMGVTLTLSQMIRSKFPAPFNHIDLDEIYVVEYALIFLTFLLPFTGLFKKLPDWFFPVIPVYLVDSILRRCIPIDPFQYWISPLAAFWALAIILNVWGYFFAKSKSSGDKVNIVASLFGGGLGAGILGLFRRNTLMESLLSVGLTLFYIGIVSWISGRKNIMTPAPDSPSSKKFFKKVPPGIFPFILFAMMLFGAILPRQFVQKLWGWRDSHYQMQNVPRNPRHPFWLPLYLGLGYVDNDLGIRWDDGSGWEHVKKRFPDVVYESEGYEKALKVLFLEAIRKEPLLLLRNILKKGGDVLYDLNWVLFLTFLLLYVGIAWKPFRFFFVSGTGWLMSLSAIPLLCVPYWIPALGFYAGSHLLMASLASCLFITIVRRPELVTGFWKRPKLKFRLFKWGFPFLLAAIGMLILYPLYLLNRTPKKEIPLSAWVLIWDADSKFKSYTLKTAADGKSQDYTYPVSGQKMISKVRIVPFCTSTIDVLPENIRLVDKKSKILEQYDFGSGKEWILKNLKIVKERDGSVGLSPQASFYYLEKEFKPIPGADRMIIRIGFIPRKTFFGWLAFKYI